MCFCLHTVLFCNSSSQVGQVSHYCPMKLYHVHCYTMWLYFDCMSPMGHFLLKKQVCMDIEITFLLFLIIIENCLYVFNLFLALCLWEQIALS